MLLCPRFLYLFCNRGDSIGERAGQDGLSLLLLANKSLYRIFRTIRCTPQIWEENGGASYSPNIAYLAHWEGRGAAVE